MTLYNYVCYVVFQLFGTRGEYGSTVVFPLLYPSSPMSGITNGHTGTLPYQISKFLSNNPSENFSWFRSFVSDPWLILSIVICLLCIWFTFELCLIMPFRWFKRLIQYPDHKLLTPNEYKRSKRK